MTRTELKAMAEAAGWTELEPCPYSEDKLIGKPPGKEDSVFKEVFSADLFTPLNSEIH